MTIIKAIQADPLSFPLPDDPKISAKMKKEVEGKVAESFVKEWKRSKALYEEYGGIVLFTHFNPMEPVGAMRKLLESHQAKGEFEIYDEQLKQQFWSIFSKTLYLGKCCRQIRSIIPNHGG